MATIIDGDYLSRVDLSGNLVEYTDDDAVSQALFLWLTSGTEDYIKNISGGPVKFLSFKNMDGLRIASYVFRIKNAIIKDFNLGIQLLDIQFTPNYQERFWTLAVIYAGLFSKTPQTVTVLIRDLSDRETQYVKEDVPYTGEDLLLFVKMEKPNQLKDKLVYDPIDGTWIWGKFKLINLTTGSANFSQILGFINLNLS